MSQAKYRSVAATLEQRVREGLVHLPTSRALAEEFQVSRQTVLAALRCLKASGVIRTRGRRGSRAVVECGHRGVIGVVSHGRMDGVVENVPVFSALWKRIAADGYEPLLLCLPGGNRFSGRICDVFNRGFSGLLFMHSSLTEEQAERLRRRHIPYIGCNWFSADARVNCMDFDHEGWFDRIVAELIAAKWRNPALFFPSQLDGFGDYITTCWRRIKRRHGLAWQEFDRFIPNRDDSCECNLTRFAQRIAASPIQADVLLYWGGDYGCDPVAILERVYGESARPLLICPENYCAIGNFTPDIRVTGYEAENFFLNCYGALRELMLAPDGQVVRRRYIPNFNFVPKISEHQP